MSDSQVWRIDEKGRWHMSNRKSVVLVVIPDGYAAFTHQKEAEAYSARYKGSVVTIPLDPSTPRTWYVEIHFQGGKVKLYANPGSAVPQDAYNLVQVHPHGLKSHYCYVLAMDGEEAKRKVKEVLRELVEGIDE